MYLRLVIFLVVSCPAVNVTVLQKPLGSGSALAKPPFFSLSLSRHVIPSQATRRSYHSISPAKPFVGITAADHEPKSRTPPYTKQMSVPEP